MNEKKVLITGVGGVVGQGIVRNIRLDFPTIKIFGTDISQLTAVNHLCEEVYQVPYAYDDSYLPLLKHIVDSNEIDLIIPSTDFEYYFLSRSKNEVNAVIPLSDHTFSEICLDKWLTFEKFSQLGIPFASTWLPSSCPTLDKSILKPRQGRGSRGIVIDPTDLKKYSDSNIVQEYLDGPEITTCFYVTKKNEIHGKITLLRDIENGSTSRCEVYDGYEIEISNIIERMCKNFKIAGSCNIQSRITNKGVIPFEINCRISGTNSIRPFFGFRDVKYTIQEYLFNEEPEVVKISFGCALRYTADLIFPGKKLADKINIHTDHIVNI